MAVSVNAVAANSARFSSATGALADRGLKANRGRQGAPAPVDAPELIINGTFDTDVSGWTAANFASLTQVSGRCRVAHTSSANPYARQEVKLEVGKTYRFKAQTFANGLANVVRVGTTPGSGNVLNLHAATDQNVDTTFTAAAEVHYVSILNFTAVGSGSIDVDNVSLKAAVA